MLPNAGEIWKLDNSMWTSYIINKNYEKYCCIWNDGKVMSYYKIESHESLISSIFIEL